MNRGFALTVDLRIHQQELPHRRGAHAEDAVVPAGDIQVAGLVADVFYARAPLPDCDLHMRQERVLGDVEADRDGCRVAVADGEVEVLDTAVEGELVGVDDWRAGSWFARGKLQHIAACAKELVARLKAWSLRAKHEDRTFGAKADEANARPEMDGAGDAIAARRYQDDAGLGRRSDLVDRGLDRCCIIGHSVCHGAKAASFQGDRDGIVGAALEDGLRRRLCGALCAGKQEQQTCACGNEEVLSGRHQTRGTRRSETCDRLHPGSVLYW